MQSYKDFREKYQTIKANMQEVGVETGDDLPQIESAETREVKDQNVIFQQQLESSRFQIAQLEQEKMDAINGIRRAESEREEALQQMRELNDRELQMKDKEITNKENRT